MMVDNSNVFELNNICFAYSGSKYVLENINLKVKHNDIIIIKGESGAGKSSFLKLFNRFSDSIEGELIFHEKNLMEYNIEEIRGAIIYLPQLPYIVDGSVEENLSFPYQFHTHSNKKFDMTRAKKMLDYFHLNFSIDYDALKLSVGQRQRIALIRAILLEPEVLLLDEPGSSLDDINRRNLENKIESLTESSGITVIMATHGEICFQNQKQRIFNIRERKLLENISS